MEIFRQNNEFIDNSLRLVTQILFGYYLLAVNSKIIPTHEVILANFVELFN